MDSANKSAVVPMRFYANWDFDRASSSAMPRTLQMKFTRLLLTKTLAIDSTFIIAVKLQGYRHILRSYDITISLSSKLDYALDISFTIQYCHFIKRKSNVLDIIIQRRKKYKNRQIPGFKTLAFGNINLDEVLQFGGSREVSMWDTACLKRLSVQDFHAGTIYISNCQSQVVDGGDQDTIPKWVLKSNGKYGNVLSEEDVDDYSSQEDSDFEDFEQQRPQPNVRRGNKRFKKINQKNIKQKVVALLKKFRIPDEDENISNAPGSTSSRVLPPTELELQEIFEELENISDSGPELEPDKVSIVSNPRPGIRPFFGSKTDNLPAITDLQIHSDDTVGDSDEPDQESSEEAQKDCYWERDVTSTSRVASLPPRNNNAGANSECFSSQQQPASVSSSAAAAASTPINSNRRAKLKHSLTLHSITSDGRPQSSFQNSVDGVSSNVRNPINVNNKKSIDNTIFVEMMSNFDVNNASPLSVVPSNIWLTSSLDLPWIQRIDKTRLNGIYFIDCPSLGDVRTAIIAIIGRIQKFCNTNSATPTTTRIGILGCDKLVSNALRIYVDALQNKSCQEWLDYLRFVVIVPPASTVGRFVGQLPAMEGYLDAIWSGNLARLSTVFDGGTATLGDHQELDDCLASITSGHNANRQQRLFNLCIGEVMLQLESTSCRSDITNEVDSSQIFVPFVSELYMGSNDDSSNNQKYSFDDSSPSQNSFIVTSSSHNAFSANVSPPVSPYTKPSIAECREVQVEYWTNHSSQQLSVTSASGGGQTPTSITSEHHLLTSSPANLRSGGTAFSSPIQSSSKFSMKMAVRNLSVARDTSTNSLCILFAKEKKKDKVLQKLGRKPKQKLSNDLLNFQSRVVSNVMRMVCSSGSGKNALSLNLTIDGVAWRRIRYFQVSAQWQTHVKLFPVSFSI